MYFFSLFNNSNALCTIKLISVPTNKTVPTSTASGLSEWFSDDVNYRGEKYTFFWGETEEYARVLSKKINEKIRYQWITEEDDEEDYFFEFKIEMDEITKDVSLIITDFSDEDELEEAKLLWDSLVSDLKQVLGST